MTDYIPVNNLNCTHRKILLTAKDFHQDTEPINRFGKRVPVVICLECKKYEVIEFK